MSTIAKSTGNAEYTPMPTGLNIARCMGVVDIGTHANLQFGSKSRKIMLMFETPENLIKDKEGRDMPMLISQEFTLSLSDKSRLRKFLVGWRGKPFTDEQLEGFDVKAVLGAACYLNIIHNPGKDNKVYANIDSAVPLPKGVTCPPAIHEPISYDIEDGTNDVYNRIPQWIQQKIQRAEENTIAPPYEQAQGQTYGQADASGEFGDIDQSDLPF